MRRSGDLGEATKRYRAIGARWPEYAHEALLGEAGVALDAHEWARAEELAAALPIETPADERVQADIERMVRRGRLLARLYALSWVVVALVALGLVGSLVSARRGARLAWSVPAEVLFAAPVVAILVVVTYAERRVFAPTVATIAGGGLVLAGLSGLALDALRARGRSARRRGLAHAAACTLAVAALAYISVSQDGVMDALIETVRSGPEG